VEAALFTPEQGRLLWQDYLRRQQLPAQQTQSFPQRRILDEPSPHRAFIYNTENETIPAYACMRVIGTRNINNVTAINVEKPSSLDGEFLFNGQYPIAAASETETGVGWAYRFGVVIMLGDAPTEPGVQYQPIIGSWEIEEGSGPFVVYGRHRANENTDDRALIGRFAGGGSGGGHTICPCSCIPAGDILVGGIETTMHWTIRMSTETFQQEFGSIMFPAGEYLVEKDPGADEWTLDIGDFLTASYASGADATAATTMSGTLTMAFDAYGGLYVSLCVDGEVPEE